MTSYRIIGSSAAALLAAGALSVAAAGPSAQAAPGTAHLAASHATTAKASKRFTFVSGGNTLNGKESTQVGLFHGAISGGGKDVALAQSDVAHIPGGTITIKHPDSQSKFVPNVDRVTCYATFTITGKFTLAKGTGKYQGIKGSGTYSAHGYYYLQKKQNGSCDMQAEAKNGVFVVTGHGTLG